MKFALFPGCKIPYHLSQYGASTRAVLEALGIEWVEIEFNCCGYPARNLDFDAYILSAARNLALAEAEGLDILTPCKCCFGALQHARHHLGRDAGLRSKIDPLLAREGLQWKGSVRVKHLLSVLSGDFGTDAIAARIEKRFSGLKIAAHYGCHALRPAAVTGFDDPIAPTIFEKLIAVTGAESVSWEKRLDCCGNPLWEKNTPLALDLMDKKLESARASGADYLCTACTYCQIQLDQVQAERPDAGGSKKARLPSILYPQLLGLSLGISEEKLGLDRNCIDITGVKKFRKG
jgi:heterodisulfide reductase subunit B2